MTMIIPPGWFKNYVQNVESDLCQKLESQNKRFTSVDKLLNKFHSHSSQLVNEQQKESPDIWRQWRIFKQVIEFHNELCVAYHLLFQQKDLSVVKLEYEPKTQSSSKHIDYRVITDIGNTIWIEVKTIHPDDRWLRAESEQLKEDDLEKRDWEQYLRWRCYFPPMAAITISRDTDGADIWHDKTSARTSMLNNVLAFEERIAELPTDTKDKFILVFVGNGFDWRLDELEDFVAFYQTGKHLPDDILQDIERHEIDNNNIHLARSIDKFAYIKRREAMIHPELFIWNVKSPEYKIME